ncbi:MAG: Zn-dependent exopeptidase M28 [bacterium]|nr:Zn-dependent exopeptidase M28 [bacterium]
MDHTALLEKIAVPRPNYSNALEETAGVIKDFLTSGNIPYTLQEFTLRHHSLLLMGAAFLVLTLILFFAVYKKRPFLVLVSILSIPLLAIIETELFVSVVSWLFTKQGENIIIQFPASDPVRELIFCAHYDSKTDVFDHIERAFFTGMMPWMVLLGVLLSIRGFLAKRFDFFARKILVRLSLFGAVVLILFSVGTFAMLGGYIFLPAEKDSPGVIDNGGSVVTLLALAEDIKKGAVDVGSSNITILLTSGEEVAFQGAIHYVKERWGGKGVSKKEPVFFINLELSGQRGKMYYAKEAGGIFSTFPAHPGLVERFNRVRKSMGKELITRDSLTKDDSIPFATAGVPVITVGHTGKPGMGFAGFHSIHDSMDRFYEPNLIDMKQTVTMVIESYSVDP